MIKVAEKVYFNVYFGILKLRMWYTGEVLLQSKLNILLRLIALKNYNTKNICN